MEIQSTLGGQLQDVSMFMAFQHAPIGIAIVDCNGKISKSNRALDELTGRSNDNGDNYPLFEELLDPADRNVYRHLQTQVIETASAVPILVHILGQDGTTVKVELSAQLIRGSSAEPLFLLIYARETSVEEAAQRSERTNNERNQSLILHNPAMILTVCLNGFILTANPAAEQLTGYSCEELIGRDSRTLLATGQADKLWELYSETPLESPVAYEACMRNKDGIVVELGVKNVPIITDGSVVGLYIIARDITDIKRQSEWKHEAELELRETVRNQQGFTFKYKRINGAFIHTLCDGELLYRMGLSPDRIIGRTLYDFMPADRAKEKESYYQRAWEGEDLVYEGRSGSLWYMASLRSIKKDGIIHEVIASCVDITEWKKAERELVEAKEQFESLFISSPTAIDLLDTNGNVIRVNPAHEALYGWTNDELQGKPMPIFPDHVRDESRHLREQLLAGRTVVDLETERLRKDGKLLTVCLTLATVRDKEGRVFGFTGLTRDITESKKAEEILRKADKLNVVGHLAAGLAHEIRNPLTSLRGFLQLLRGGHREKDSFYDLMLSELDRINNILGELLIIAKPQVSHFQRKNLRQMLVDVLILLEPQALLQKVEYLTIFDAAEMPVHCSETELKQVFINIIKNGMEAMPQGGILTVELTASWHDEIIIRISDQGVGIPEDRIPRLGEPFYTTKEKGTGLGLMMCYKIIEAHNGTISFTNRESGGTTVNVSLPLVRDQLKTDNLSRNQF
ncbi:PAS domain S-box protein [Cohnella kolymensis]|uniref:PAS domain S-box protein n=1 Tax=Cohnella kolymensis TaxID=1590652 RepID=UPI0009E31657|nr:PAS domain S-box protein [Cohnella kolymensis]